MASLVAETWGYINGDDDGNGVEISKFNSALLMFLLDETHGEEYNDEQLNRIIQSLEDEISANMLEPVDALAIEREFLGAYEAEDGENCLAAMEFEFAETLMEMVPSSPSDDMNWYMEYCGNEFDVMVEHGDATDYRHIYKANISLEEDGFSSLWQ